MKQLLRILVLWLTCTAGPVMAMSFVYYQQSTTASADGEVYVVGLADGPFVLSTPDHPHMQHGIKRYGNRLLVTLQDIRWPGVLPGVRPPTPPQLRVVIEQDGEVVTSAWPLAIAPPATAEPSATVAVTALSESGTAPAPDPEPDPPADMSCPVIAVHQGSLRRNVDRLVGECGRRMGQWFAPSADPAIMADWNVAQPRILQLKNHRGFDGLLDILLEHYRLRGVRAPGETDVINFYKI